MAGHPPEFLCSRQHILVDPRNTWLSPKGQTYTRGETENLFGESVKNLPLNPDKVNGGIHLITRLAEGLDLDAMNSTIRVISGGYHEVYSGKYFRDVPYAQPLR